MLETIYNEKINLLADQLIENMRKKTIFFDSTVIVFPNKKTEQWFKAYFLKNKDDVLMNISCKSLNEVLLSLFNLQKYEKIIKKDTLRLFIINNLLMYNEVPDAVIHNYIYDNGVVSANKLFDISNELSKLFMKYERENFKITGFQNELYQNVLNSLHDYNFTTLKDLYNRASSGQLEYVKTDKEIHFFGFSYLDILTDSILKEYQKNSPIILYYLKEEDCKKPEYELIASPSKEREVIALHGKVCKLIQESNCTYSDFLFLSPNIDEYENVIAKVFKQDDVNFPNIPYSIPKTNKNNELYSGLKVLFDCVKKGYYSRFDVIDLLNNKIIQAIFELSIDDINICLNAIAKMNVFRNRDFMDDWDYFKKRIIISKIVDINQENNDVIMLSGKDYTPFTDISLTNELIIKFTQIIDDLTDFVRKLNTKLTITEDIINYLIEFLTKWFYIEDNIEGLTNKELNKVLNELNSYKNYKLYNKNYELINNKIPLLTVLYDLLDICNQTQVTYESIFTNGITFINYDERAILNAKYIFFMGFDSKTFPKYENISELDQTRMNKETAYDIFKLQILNAYDKVFFSYVNCDLKTDEEFYLSNYVDRFISDNGKTLENKINLDENRKWSELFTKKEFNDKNYYYALFNEEVISESMSPVSKEIEKKVTISKMSEFLSEPLKYNANKLFKIYDSIGDKLDNEFEPFNINRLDEYSINLKIIKYMLENKKESLDVSEAKEILYYDLINNEIPNINQKLLDLQIQKIIDTCKKVIEIIFSETNKEYNLYHLNDLDLEISNTLVTIISNSDICVYEKKEENRIVRKYYDLKKAKDKINLRDFIKLYIESLIDIAWLDHDNEICINLHKCTTKGTKKYDYKINKTKAKDLLIDIYKAMNDLKYANYCNIDCVNDVKTYDDLIDNYLDIHKSPWVTYDDAKIFNDEKLGYTERNFKTEFEKMNELMNKLVLIVKKKENNEEKKDENNEG